MAFSPGGEAQDAPEGVPAHGGGSLPDLPFVSSGWCLLVRAKSPRRKVSPSERQSFAQRHRGHKETRIGLIVCVLYTLDKYGGSYGFLTAIEYAIGFGLAHAFYGKKKNDKQE